MVGQQAAITHNESMYLIRFGEIEAMNGPGPVRWLVMAGWLQVPQIVAADATGMLSLVMYLFNYLPSLSPQGTLTFNAKLGELQVPPSRALCLSTGARPPLKIFCCFGQLG